MCSQLCEVLIVESARQSTVSRKLDRFGDSSLTLKLVTTQIEVTVCDRIISCIPPGGPEDLFVGVVLVCAPIFHGKNGLPARTGNLFGLIGCLKP